MVNFAPFPFLLSKVKSPPMAFASRLLAAKPNPCPLDLVMNSGLKILGLISSDMLSPQKLRNPYILFHPKIFKVKKP